MTEVEFDMFRLRAELEASLVMAYWPFFLSVDIIDHGNDTHTFNVTLGSTRFADMTVNDRISDVFRLIKEDKIDTSDQTIVVECFDSAEFEDLIDQSFI
jgi:hypothetical protein